MDPKLKELIEKFSGYDIEVFYGQPNHYANTDFLLYDIQSLIEYCNLNAIHSVFFDCQYADDANNTIDQLKTELENKYQTRVTGYVTGIFKLPYIDEAFYAPVWEKIAEAIDNEFQGVNNSHSDNNQDETITSICVWAFHQGIRLFTVVDLVDQDPSQNESAQKLLKQKYHNMLLEELSLRYQEASRENKRIEQKKQQVILDEIAQTVSQDQSLDSLVTVKARNDYADRICVAWQVERGHEWLTKKAVRAIIELDYAKRKS